MSTYSKIRLVIALAIIIIALALVVASNVWGQDPTLRLSEVAWAGTEASHYDEWFEVVNDGTVAVDTTGWYLLLDLDDKGPEEDARIYLTFDKGATQTPDGELGIGVVLEPGWYGLFERTDDTAVSNRLADGIYTGGLRNTGVLSLSLVNPDGRVVDRVPESGDFADAVWPWGSNEAEGKPTMSRSEDGSWHTSSYYRGALDAGCWDIVGSPGAPNAPAEASLGPAPNSASTIYLPLIERGSSPGIPECGGKS